MPQIGKEYDWHCPDVGILRVTVVGLAPHPSDPEHSPESADLCRVRYERGTAWAAIADLHEIPP